MWKDVCDAVTSCQTPEDFDGSLTQTQAIISVIHCVFSDLWTLDLWTKPR